MQARISIFIIALLCAASVTVSGAGRFPQQDTTVVKNLVTTAMDLFHAGKLDSALQLAVQARNLADKLQYKKGYGSALLASGYAYRLKGSYSAAIKDFNEALLIFNQIGDDLNSGRTHNFLAQTYQNLGDQKKVIDHLILAKQLVEKKGHQAGLSVIYMDIGNYYSDHGNYELALENFSKSLNASTSIKADSKIAVALNNIGVVYERLQELVKAEDYYNQGLAVATAANIISKRTLLMVNLAGIQILNGDFASAEKNLNEAQRIARDSDDKEGLGLALNKLGDLYVKKTSFVQAERFYTEALSLSRQIQNADLVLRSLNGISEVKIVSKDYASARENLNEALALAIKLEAKESQRVIYLSMSKLDSAKAAFKDAFLWYQRYSLLNDSLIDQQNASRVAFLKSQVATTAGGVQVQPESITSEQPTDFKNAGLNWNQIVVVLSIMLIGALATLAFFAVRLKLKSQAFEVLRGELKSKEETAKEEFI